MNLLKSLLPLMVVMLLHACGKGTCYQVSNVSFSTTISQGQHPGVYAIGGWEYADGGVCGLIVYNTGNGLVAYDRCSTVEASQGGRVEVDEDMFTIVDPVSEAKWMLLDGSPADIAECSLWRYSVTQAGHLYYVRN